ncbi:hypothetical protein R1sor_002813 [Riccia sorocarpa]|uniref:cyclin-dependent kinase n=1 Tax=Riccia sorocarpa TaxID=122646 RepID=A0ABD3H409_9MARC
MSKWDGCQRRNAVWLDGNINRGRFSRKTRKTKMEPTESSWSFKDTWSLHGNREIVSRYQILEKIGEGAFADVYRAVRRDDGQIVALKEIHDSDSSYREVKALLLLDHPNVVKLYEYFVQGSNMVLVLEYLPNNLSQVVKAGNISEADVKGWSIQILQGLTACHDASIVHRDIKPANLLIGEDGTLKIADFGTARVLSKDYDEIDQYGYGSEVVDGGYSNPDSFIPPVEADVIGISSTSSNPLNTPNGETRSDEPQAADHQISPDGRGGDDDEKEKVNEASRQEVEEGNRHSDSCADNGKLCLASNDSVVEDGGGRYVEVEEMVRNGDQLIGLRTKSASHLRTRSQGEDPGCCGWFSSSEKEDVADLNKPKEDGYRSDPRHVDKYTSSDESDGSWKEKRGLQNLISKPNSQVDVFQFKSGDDFDRGIKKRTRRVSSLVSVPFPEFQEGSTREEEDEEGKDDEVWKEPLKNWPQASQLLDHSSFTNVFARSSTEIQPSYSLETSSGHKESPFQRNGIVLSKGSHKGSGLHELEMQRSHKYMPSGPLREMADACLGSEMKNEEVENDDVLSPPPGDGIREKEPEGLVGPHKVETVSGNPELPGNGTLSVLSEDANSAYKTISRSGPISIQGGGGGGRDNQIGQELGYGSPGSGKVGGASWIDMGENVGSPSDAEGTRWFGAPEFRDSYMEARNQKGTATASGETGRVDSEFEEWEDVAEGGIYRDGGRSSRGTSDRGENKSEDVSEFTTMVGTRWYRAPELLYGATKYGMEVDIWAFGCIFGELLSGKPLFPGINDIDQLSRLVRILGSPTEKEWEGVTLLPDYGKIRFVDDRSPLTLRNHLPNISENSLQFLGKVLAYDPKRRLTAVQGLEDDYFLKEPVPTPPSSLTIPPADSETWDLDEDTMTGSEWGSYGLQNVGLYDYPSDSEYYP